MGNLLDNQRGLSLVMAVMVGTLVTMIGYATVATVVMESRTTVSYLQSTQAFWLAESGIELAYNWLRFQDPSPGGTDAFVHYNGVAAGAGTYTVTIDPDDNNTNTYLKQYKIVSVGRVADIERKLEILTQTTTFNRYAYLTGDEGGTIWFNSGDLIEGPIHSNDMISIVADPVFMGKVTSSANSFNEGSPFNPDFQDGYQLGVPEVQFPTEAEVMGNYWESNTDPPVLTIDATSSKHASVEFHADGTLTYNVWHYSWWSGLVYDIQNATANVDDLDGILYVDGDVSIEGTLQGNLTVIATDDITITDDVVYHDSDSDGKPTASSQDMLGLVSHRDIIVADNSANRNDVVINGALLALANSFTVENYYWGSARGNLTIWGSLSQKVRGPVGTFGYYGTTGYQKDYHYDSRFLNQAPSYFPATGQYHFQYWKEITE